LWGAAQQKHETDKEKDMKLNSKLVKNTVAVIGLLAIAATSAAAQEISIQVNSRVVKPGQEYQGKSYNQLASEWTAWLAAEPIATNPAFDPDGRFCDQNQEGDVWFLASTFGGVVDRTCEIPAGKAIFLSLGGVFLGFAPEFPAAGDPCLQLATDVDKVRCDVNDDVPVAPGTSLEATLDGVPVKDLFAFRAQSQPGGFTLRVPNPSLITDLGLAPGDRSPAVADGYFLYLKPLKPGVHTLNFRKINPDQSEAGVNYTLIIQ
jgi:hypothetical protein